MTEPAAEVRPDQAGLRMTSDRDYRRGVVLGLTLAEVLLLLIFLLLLAAGALMSRARQQAIVAMTKQAQLEAALRPLLDQMKANGTDIATAQDIAAILDRARRSDEFRSALAAANRRVATAERAAQADTAVLKRQTQELARATEARDDAIRALKAAQGVGASQAIASEKAQAFDVIAQAMPGQAGSNQRPGQIAETVVGQVRQMTNEFKRIKGSGSGLPHCWPTPSGDATPMLRVELRDGGFIAHELPARARPDDPAWRLLAPLAREAIVGEDALNTATQALVAQANRQQCRYAVIAEDCTSDNNKKGYQHLSYVLDQVFFRREIRCGHG